MKTLSWLILSLCLLCSTACQQGSAKQTLKVAASSVPHADILEVIKPELKSEGIDLEIIVVEDYNTPNRALADGEVDANFFQHPVFLALQMKDFHYPLEILNAVHLEPMGLYSHQVKSLDDLKEYAKIAVPSDPSNQARALALLEKVGLISLRQHGSHASILDIAGNPRHLKLIEIDSPLLARSLEDVDMAAITTNFALQAGLNPQKDALASEGPHSPFVNVIVIRKGESQRADLQALKKALQSEKVHRYIEEQYKGSILFIGDQ